MIYRRPAPPILRPRRAKPITPRRRRAEALGTASKILFALAAPIVFCALIAAAAMLLVLLPAWLLALISGDLTKRAPAAWDALAFEDQQ